MWRSAQTAGLLLSLLASACAGSDGDPITGAASCDDLAEPIAGVVNEFGSAPTDVPGIAEIEVAVFLHDSLGPDEASALLDEVAGWEGVASVTFFTKEDALVEFREMFRDQPSLIEIVEEDPSILPASLRLRLDGTVGLGVLTDRLLSTPGVFQVRGAEDAVNDFASHFWRLSASLRERYASISDRADALGCDIRDVVDTASDRGLLEPGIFADWLLEEIRAGTLQG
ncbi:MAG TPA: permease-like cell division protein FtsX [Acidimicrobiia bacterium]|nr:permease-like cell division protein FtsX [Acidimicrobiia bacterium]